MLDLLLPYVDFIFAGSAILLGVVLIPTILDQFKRRMSTISLLTSSMTVVGLLAIALSQAALGLWLAVAMTVFDVGLWCIVALQRIIYSKEGNDHDDG